MKTRNLFTWSAKMRQIGAQIGAKKAQIGCKSKKRPLRPFFVVPIPSNSLARDWGLRLESNEQPDLDGRRLYAQFTAL